MVLACEQPDQVRNFYREVTGGRLADADFVPAPGPRPATAPQWELVVAVDDVDTWLDETGGREARLTSPEGLTVRLRRPDRLSAPDRPR